VAQKLIVVIGLPGSGKSHYLKELRDKGVLDWICEDFHADAYRNSEHVVDSRHLAPLVENLQHGLVCGVADIAFCNPVRLQEFLDEIRARVPGAEIEFHCFKNDKARCAENVDHRARESAGSEKGLIEKFSPGYTIPEGAKILDVYPAAKKS
jgi:hypothetical protein